MQNFVHLGAEVGRRSSKSSDTSKLTVHGIHLIIVRLKSKQSRESTAKNYISIWHNFNSFLGQLDYMPRLWENRVALFCAYLIEKHKTQSSTIRSYISAIKHTLKVDGYDWNDGIVYLGALVKACKLTNDVMHMRLPIQFGLFELILFELQ